MTKLKNGGGFRALLATQFLGAFNDNAFKLVILFLTMDLLLTKSGQTQYLSLASVLFILPFLLFSTYAGYFADRFSKKNVIVGTKIAELGIMFAGFIALFTGSLWGMFTVLFFMGLQSTVFGPAKYGILPEILPREELSEGNGAIQLWTYVAIILGTSCGGFIFDLVDDRAYKASFVFMFISGLGILTSVFIKKVPASGTKRPFEWNFFKEIWANVKKIRSDRPLFISVLGLVYFSLFGGLFQLNILLYAREVMGIDQIQTGLLLTTAALGLGMGCFFAGKLSDKKIEFGLVPLGAIGLSIFSIRLGFTAGSFTWTAVTLFLLGFSSGFYILPLGAFIQHRSPGEKKGQVLATVNFLSFSAILVASGALYLLREKVGLNSAQIFVVAGITTVAMTVYICRLLPRFLLRFVFWVLAHTLYKFRVIGRSNIPEEGGALLVSNHISYVDGLLVLGALQREVRFIVHRRAFEIRLLGSLLRLANAIPISGSDKPKDMERSLDQVRQALKSGYLVCIFAEGGLTRTGNMMKFNKGLEHIMKGMEIPIIPVHLDRIWGSIFSFERKRVFFKRPRELPYPVTVSFGVSMPSGSTAFQVRSRVLELGADAFRFRLDKSVSLPEAFWKEARKHPFKFCMADSLGKELSYIETLIGAVVLSHILRKKFSQDDMIGILLPPSVAGALVNLAVSIARKVPVNLNYTASDDIISSILKRCNIRRVITSRRVLEKLNISIPVETVYVEDLIKQVSRADRLRAVLKSMIFPGWLSRRLIFGRSKFSLDELATVMFTSGSTGVPKGVMLTHANIKSNLKGLCQVFSPESRDVNLGVLPFFHSFGYTATLWFPLLSGTAVAYHMNPLDAKTIGKLVKKYKVTMLMSTPTFLLSYIRRCSPEQFMSLRVVIAGAEKLKDKVAHEFKQKFGIEPMEGYGCTELSPIVSLSLPDFEEKGVRQKAFKPGKIGQPLPGIAVKVIDVNTQVPLEADQEGLLLVKGQNVMKGYLDMEEETGKVVRDGWYITGDIASMDEDGFLKITDRLNRFSKIAGEMVPHIKIEDAIHTALNTVERVCVVAAVPDEKRGERLVVLYTGEVDVPLLISNLRGSGLPKLWIPGEEGFYRIDVVPLLGSGKVDLSALKKKAVELAREGAA